MMTRLKITAKGQVTLRKEVLTHLGVAPGDQILVDLLPAGRVEARAAKAPGTIESFIGCLKGESAVRSPSIEEINEIAADAWAGLP